ncbi:hypothetical protein A0H81_13934 [Grifola frondosa]|uniref:Uncharacterized protein n=1 Tax=Grifola frondosa TaxID=5627 RepID=A0A1C7LMX6_GRIFR|nr:hypothetical protein A0H81_13934 [Grifola frondosa]
MNSLLASSAPMKQLEMYCRRPRRSDRVCDASGQALRLAIARVALEGKQPKNFTILPHQCVYTILDVLAPGALRRVTVHGVTIARRAFHTRPTLIALTGCPPPASANRFRIKDSDAMTVLYWKDRHPEGFKAMGVQAPLCAVTARATFTCLVERHGGANEPLELADAAVHLSDVPGVGISSLLSGSGSPPVFFALLPFFAACLSSQCLSSSEQAHAHELPNIIFHMADPIHAPLTVDHAPDQLAGLNLVLVQQQIQRIHELCLQRSELDLYNAHAREIGMDCVSVVGKGGRRSAYCISESATEHHVKKDDTYCIPLS